MKPYVLILLVTFCSACGVQRSVSPEIRGYFSQLDAIATEKGITLNRGDVVFRLVGSPTGVDVVAGRGVVIAGCVPGIDDEKVIEVSKAYWDHASEDDKESVVFHEMGHCLLGRDHDATGYDAKTKAYTSLMYPAHIPGAEFKKHKKELLEELFTTGPQRVISEDSQR